MPVKTGPRALFLSTDARSPGDPDEGCQNHKPDRKNNL